MKALWQPIARSPGGVQAFNEDYCILLQLSFSSACKSFN